MELYSAAVGKGWGSCSSEGAGQAEERVASEIEVWVPLDHGHQILEKDDMIYKCHTRHSMHIIMYVGNIIIIYVQVTPSTINTEVHLTGHLQVCMSTLAYVDLQNTSIQTIASGLCIP